ncbi:uncharacterized protein TM35_000411800 [Trypanosoma theileri]|uniref:C2 domain-containing protein n=1 Tax=Trypanosoma theileri TaxID=67003 RepID=A0A1X0NL23_9TRYP|nr:uncharacterized protein TM35_000411800 [Trypanosoma theileri]ORC84810.1 hypothetical protein TM35_000411800 [Trypanosoma theileri]
MSSPSSIIKIRILNLDVLSEDAGDFKRAGLYVVARVGSTVQRTDVLGDSDDMTWNELFVFHLDNTPTALIPSAPHPHPHPHSSLPTPSSPPGLSPHISAVTPAPVIESGPISSFPQYSSGLGEHFTTDLPHLRQQKQQQLESESHLGSRGLPWMVPPYRIPTVMLELWRNTFSSDDCLAKYQFCIPLEGKGEVLDRVVRLTSASSYSVQFALRVRVGLVQHNSFAMGSNSILPNRPVPMATPVFWRP